MTDISVQFYATEEELGEWLISWVNVHRIELVGMSFQPFYAGSVRPNEIQCVIRDNCIKRFYLFASRPELHVENKVEFENKNKDALVLEIGRSSKDGLGESWLACRTGQDIAIRKWRSIAADLKEKTQQGVTAINRQSGVAAFYDNYRYSPKAAALEAAGTPMVPIQGRTGPIIRLGALKK